MSNLLLGNIFSLFFNVSLCVHITYKHRWSKQESSDSGDIGYGFFFLVSLVFIWLHYKWILCCSWLYCLYTTWAELFIAKQGPCHSLMPLAWSKAGTKQQGAHVPPVPSCCSCYPDFWLFAEKCLIAGLGWRRRKDISKTTWLSVHGRQKMRKLDKLIIFCSSVLIQPELALTNKNLCLISGFFSTFVQIAALSPYRISTTVLRTWELRFLSQF